MRDGDHAAPVPLRSAPTPGPGLSPAGHRAALRLSVPLVTGQNPAISPIWHRWEPRGAVPVRSPQLPRVTGGECTGKVGGVPARGVPRVFAHTQGAGDSKGRAAAPRGAASSRPGSGSGEAQSAPEKSRVGIAGGCGAHRRAPIPGGAVPGVKCPPKLGRKMQSRRPFRALPHKTEPWSACNNNKKGHFIQFHPHPRFPRPPSIPLPVSHPQLFGEGSTLRGFAPAVPYRAVGQRDKWGQAAGIAPVRPRVPQGRTAGGLRLGTFATFSLSQHQKGSSFLINF